MAVSIEDLILFDQVFVLDLENQLSALHDFADPLAADAEFLATEGFLLEGPGSAYQLGLEIISELEIKGGRAMQFMDEISDRERELLWMSSSSRHPSMLGRGALFDDERRGKPFVFGGEVIVAHVYSRLGIPCVPVVPRYPTIDELYQNFIAIPQSLGSKREALLEVIVQSLPVPANDIPLADVLDFSRERETRRQRDALLRNLTKAELTGISNAEFALGLEDALSTYSDQMRISDLRMRSSTARFFIAATGMLEELLHARPKAALNELVEFRQQRIDRLELEINAPGSEVALLYSAQRVFAQRRWSY